MIKTRFLAKQMAGVVDELIGEMARLGEQASPEIQTGYAQLQTELKVCSERLHASPPQPLQVHSLGQIQGCLTNLQVAVDRTKNANETERLAAMQSVVTSLKPVVDVVAGNP